ncbi:Zn(2)-C6 fungal-type DNA-binding domain [Fusarium oxysporum f. sp. vasinfectum]|nr:Zn(2)-C6 fungal-type DNA-binding domain [Fusarium oxysporum f. sp. vasinfectum]
MASSDIASRCVALTFATPTLFGAEFLSIEANVVPDYSFDVPRGWTYSQPSLNVQNVTFCNVTVTYTHTGQNDTLHAEAWLPSENNYNGRLQSLGGSGWTPGRYILTYAGMINAVANGYASVTTDAGIPEAASPAEWLLTTPGNINTNALQNFGQVSLDDEASIAKQLIRSFYGKAPLYSYWNACSQGGRQGLKLAQQYPSAYDGIIAAAPAINWAEFYINSIWPLRSQLAMSWTGSRMASSATLTLVGANLTLSNRLGRLFTALAPSRSSRSATLLLPSPMPRGLVPHFSNGKSMYPGYEIGTDLPTLAPTNCTGTVCKSGGEGSVEFAWKTFVKKDMAATLKNATGRDFDTIYRHVKQIFASNLETNEVDLRDFRDAGGKMITYHGLADPAFPLVARFSNVTSFYKYYQVPALGHCWGGKGGQPEALFDQLRAWRVPSSFSCNGPKISFMLATTKDILLSVPGLKMNETQETEHIHSAGSRCPCRPVQRRSHKKSRNGCQTCKKRRIKCDENKPVCKNCSHLSFTCSFDTASDAATKTTVVPIRPRQRGRPLTWASDPGISTQALVPISMDRQLSSPSQQSLPLNIDDLRLYHHYITVASLTFGDDAMWHDKIPLLAFDNHFVLHLMLAVSGLHLARFQTLEATKYEKLAEHHHSKALSHVTNLLPQINHQNCSALYIATVLICNYAFAKPPKKGHLLVPFDGTETAWWNLFRGVRFVIETMGLTAIFSGPIGPFPPETASSIPPPVGRAGYIAWEKPLADLRTMIHDSQTPRLPDLLELYEALVCCFSGVFGTADRPQDATHGKMHIVMRWVWFLGDDFTKQYWFRRWNAFGI